MPELTDEAVENLIISHLSRGCGDCSNDKYADADKRLARHIVTNGHTNQAFVSRVKRILFDMRNRELLRLTVRGGGICDVKLIEAPQLPKSDPLVNEPAHPAANPFGTPDIAARSAVVESDLPPMKQAFRLLILSWLLSNEGRVESPHGEVSSLFRENFGLDATGSARSTFASTLAWMEAQGEISRQKTANSADETADPIKWHRSRRTFAISLRAPMATGELAKLVEALNEAKTKVGLPIESADSLVVPAGPDKPTPTHDVLIANEADRIKLAERIHAEMLVAHAALMAAVEAGARRFSTTSDIYAISMSGVLKNAGFDKSAADELTFYLKQVGFTTTDRAGNGLWWWRIPPEPPKLDAVKRQIVLACKIYQPTKVFTEPTPGTVPPRAYSATWRDTRTTLGDHQVGKVRVTNEKSEGQVPSTSPVPKPAPPAVRPSAAPAVTFSPPAAVQEENAVAPDEPIQSIPPPESTVIHELIIAQLTDQVATLNGALAAARQELTSTKDRLTAAIKVGEEARREADEAIGKVHLLQAQLETLATPAIKRALALLRGDQDA